MSKDWLQPENDNWKQRDDAMQITSLNVNIKVVVSIVAAAILGAWAIAGTAVSLAQTDGRHDASIRSNEVKITEVKTSVTDVGVVAKRAAETSRDNQESLGLITLEQKHIKETVDKMDAKLDQLLNRTN